MGRPKGSKNIRSFSAEEIAKKVGVDPLEILLLVAKGDWKALGYKEESKISYTNAGIEFEEPHIRLADRVNAAKAAAPYLHATMQSVAISSPDGSGIKVIIEDYKGK